MGVVPNAGLITEVMDQRTYLRKTDKRTRWDTGTEPTSQTKKFRLTREIGSLLPGFITVLIPKGGKMYKRTQGNPRAHMLSLGALQVWPKLYVQNRESKFAFDSKYEDREQKNNRIVKG